MPTLHSKRDPDAVRPVSGCCSWRSRLDRMAPRHVHCAESGRWLGASEVVRDGPLHRGVSTTPKQRRSEGRYSPGGAAPSRQTSRVTVVKAPDDPRFTAPLYTVRQTAAFLQEPENRVRYWVQGRGPSLPLVSSKPDPRRWEAEIPFIGLAEALVVSFLRRRNLSLQYIRRALDKLSEEMTIEYALASRRFYTDGVKALFRYKSPGEDFSPLAEILSQQYVLEDLEIVSFAPDGWAGRLVLPFVTDRPIIEVDPKRAFGKPLFIRGGARLQDVLARLRARDRPDRVARDFGVPVEDVLDIVSALLPEAA